MAERVKAIDQAMIVENDSAVESMRETCFMIREFFKIVMYAIYNKDLAGACGGGDRLLGSIYYYDINENCKFGILDVYEIQTGDGKLILPGAFQGDDTVSTSRVPSSFHSFPNRIDYIDIHKFESDFQEVYQREYRDPEVNLDENDTQSNDNDSTPMDTGRSQKAGYRRMTMGEISDGIHSRHDPCSPNMKNIEQRMRTFKGWGLHGDWAADQIAQAGFFRTGFGDQAECYHCGYRVYVWDEKPLVLHVRWAPRCRFLRDTYPLDLIYGILFNRSTCNSHG